MSDRRTFLRNLVTLPLIGGGVTLIGRPAAPIPLVQAAALPSLDDPRQRARYAWEAFSAAMGEVAAAADGWCIVGAADRWTPLPGPHPNTGSFLRVASLHLVEEPFSRTVPRTILVERHREIDLEGRGTPEGWA